MPFSTNQNNRSLLDSAARLVRERAVPGSRFWNLMHTSTPAQVPYLGSAADRLSGREWDSVSADLSDLQLPYTDRLVRSIDPSQPQIGDMPPQPPTLRGGFGAMLVRIVRRALFWYTGQIGALHALVAGSASELARSLHQTRIQQRRHDVFVSGLQERLEALERQAEVTHNDGLSQINRLAERLDVLTNQSAHHETSLRAVQESHKELLTAAGLEQNSIRDSFAQLNHTITSMEEQGQRQTQTLLERISLLEGASRGHHQQSIELTGERLDRIDQTLTDHQHTTNDLQEQVKAARQQLHETKTRLLQQDLRLTMLLREARKNHLKENGPLTAGADDVGHMLDPLFVDHARTFRGSREEIKNRLRVYLASAQEAFQAAAPAPALDLGCGRGEWLEVLAKAGIPARGYDWNRELVNGCGELGLNAAEGAIPQVLRTLPDESCSIISAFHLVEHISFQDLLELIDQTVRLLKTGGIAIFETPDPKNLLVSSNNFYLDPTHHHPIPSELLAFLVESRGLCEPRVIPLSPFPDYLHLQGSDCPAVKFLNEQFFGPQEYGVIAHKA